MDVLTGSLDDGAKEGGLIVSWVSRQRSTSCGWEWSPAWTVSLRGSGPHREVEDPQQACISEGITHKRGTEGASLCLWGKGL